MFGISLYWTVFFIIYLNFFLFIGLIALFSAIYRHIVLFQLTFSFIYSTFSKKILVSIKKVVPKRTLKRSLYFADHKL